MHKHIITTAIAAAAIAVSATACIPAYGRPVTMSRPRPIGVTNETSGLTVCPIIRGTWADNHDVREFNEWWHANGEPDYVAPYFLDATTGLPIAVTLGEDGNVFPFNCPNLPEGFNG